MKLSSVFLVSLMSLPILDFVAAGFQLDLVGTASAAVAVRRTAFAATGPAGGTVVGASRTAFATGPYYFRSTAESDTQASAAVRVALNTVRPQSGQVHLGLERSAASAK